MSALNRLGCPHCGGEVLILKGAATRRWICCHCGGTIDMDPDDRRGPAKQADTGALEWEPLPTAHAAPPLTPGLDLAPPLETARTVDTPRTPMAERTDRQRASDNATWRFRLREIEGRATLVNTLAVAFGVLALLVFLYPGRLEPGGLLPVLSPYFQSRAVLYPFVLLNPRILLTVMLCAAASGFYYGRSWSTPMGVGALVLLCIAFQFHPLAILIAIALGPLVWRFRHSFRRAHV